MPGYSSTPLIKKLGIKPPLKLLVVDAPPEYATWLGELPPGVALVSAAGRGVEGAHIFFTDRLRLEKRLLKLRSQLVPDGYVWVSWPKQAAKVPTDLSEGVIRNLALPLGFVDIKVCAVSDVWSGLKLVIRKSERNG